MPRLWQRLFLAIAVLSTLALAGFAIWQQQGFRRGFIGYLNEVALERLQPATGRFAAAYSEHGGWGFLREDPSRFAELVDPEARRPRLPPDGFGPRDPDRPEPRPPRFDDREPRAPGPMGPPPGEPRFGPPGLLGRVQLVDSEGRHIAGNAELGTDVQTLAITVDGNTIGTLRLATLPQLRGDADLAFAREQFNGALIAAVGVLGCALLLAFALARWLLEPVRALASGTRALAAGDYASRIAQTRRDELGALADDFNHLAATLEQHRDARRRWGADIAHELRTPLSILRGEIQALQDGVRAPTPQALASLNAECDRLAGLVEDLYQLALADVGALEYRFEAIDLADIVRESLAMHRHALTDSGLVFETVFEPVAAVRGDARRLGQLVDNLLANARRYTDAPGRIRITVDAAERGVRFAIEDTPPGVPVDALPRLFDRLYRVDGSRNRAAGGAGLGLAICEAIVAAHDGSITASPSPLGGLCITVTLPFAGSTA